MDALPASVTHALPLRLIDGTGAALKLTAELRYDAADPYAVDAVFHTGEPRGVRWVFARDLLSEGLFRPSGDGDVHVSPLVDESGQAIVLIELRSPDGEAVLHAPADGLAAFLQSTYAIIAPGQESSHVDLDVLVETLRRSPGSSL
ncbi:SsgA family sporulation/cell division regulator [Actinopolymorpha alba]|uniref:SsgA family sporulation/cell division regulator n=1 Tax=Actinopolymorpha alba TaxID=533267 RepID=UPI000368F460|nr:SsgA family sporulation/cell division regulator [Actinopolymorpha alba]